MTAPDSGAGSGSGSGSWLIGGRYRIVERIGSGGMAEVFRAHDEVLARDVAVKVFRRVSTTPDTAAGAERQRTELQALARLAHPNLITLFDGSLEGEDGSPAYLVMELIEGATLADAIERDAVSAGEVRAIGAQIGSALAYVHAANMVHRDVKPANILLGTDATAGTTTVRARLSDFGIVRLIGDDGHTGTQFTLGTASYLAPEQARGSSVGPPADVYALGLVLLEALTRIRAFDGPPLEAAMARLSRDPDIPANLPAPWPQLLASMTQRDPAQRPTAQQVVDVLGRPDGASDATTAIVAPIVAPMSAGPPTAATTALAAEPLGPVRRAPVGDTRSMPPVPPVAPPPARSGAAGPPPRKGLPTLVWLALAAAVVVLIIIVVALMATSGGGGSSPTTDTTSPSVQPNSSSTSAPSSRPVSSTTTHRHSSSSAPSTTKATTPSSSSTTKKAPGPPTHSKPAPPTKATKSKPTPKPPASKTAAATTSTSAAPGKSKASPPGK
jgi:serine/threonine protein kinase